eukprot:scaffold195918_cov26-Tisochrysis_lutea.AAC.4
MRSLPATRRSGDKSSGPLAPTLPQLCADAAAAALAVAAVAPNRLKSCSSSSLAYADECTRNALGRVARSAATSGSRPPPRSLVKLLAQRMQGEVKRQLAERAIPCFLEVFCKRWVAHGIDGVAVDVTGEALGKLRLASTASSIVRAVGVQRRANDPRVGECCHARGTLKPAWPDRQHVRFKLEEIMIAEPARVLDQSSQPTSAVCRTHRSALRASLPQRRCGQTRVSLCLQRPPLHARAHTQEPTHYSGHERGKAARQPPRLPREPEEAVAEMPRRSTDARCYARRPL